ncbi:protein kinase domain-containing protein [Nannocystaceae bacterium ST9]
MLTSPAAMICAECAEEVEEDLRRCPACGGEPLLAERLRIDAIEQIDALGTTYRGTRVADALPVWLRELPFRRGPGDPGQQLEREGARLAELRHPVLPNWIEHFVRREGRGGALWLVQAQVGGTPLARLARERPLDESELLARLEPLADLLVYLHARNPPVVHAGITPSSVIETEAGNLLLVGFNAIGTEREISPTSGSGVQSVARAMASMAPEQFFGRSEPATDVWALGLIAIVLLTGATPLELRDADHQLLWRERVRVDDSLAQLLDTMLDRDPAKRPRAAALREAIAGLRRSFESTDRLLRDDVLRDRDRPAAVAGTIGERRSPEPDSPSTPARTQVIREARRPVRRARRSDSAEDVPVMRPADLSRELSQAQQATELLLDRARRRVTAARMTIVLVVALVTAGLLLLALLEH